jgi:hypothetical protein
MTSTVEVLQRLSDGACYVRTQGPTLKVVAQTYSGCDTSRQEARDYARLFAAAPDMLQALLGLQVIAERYVEDLAADAQEGGPVAHMELARWQAVGNAIAKALGNTESLSNSEGA